MECICFCPKVNTQLEMVVTNTEYFKFLADEYSCETGSFNGSCSQLTWMNMSTTQKNSICGLNFADSTDEARLDLLITISHLQNLVGLNQAL